MNDRAMQGRLAEQILSGFQSPGYNERRDGGSVASDGGQMQRSLAQMISRVK